MFCEKVATPNAEIKKQIKRQVVFHLPIFKHISSNPESKKQMAVFIFMEIKPGMIDFNIATSNNHPAMTVSAKIMVNKLTEVSNVDFKFLNIFLIRALGSSILNLVMVLKM